MHLHAPPAVITKVPMPSVSTKLPAELIQPPELIVRLLGDIMVHCTASGTDDVVAWAYTTHTLAVSSTTR